MDCFINKQKTSGLGAESMGKAEGTALCNCVVAVPVPRHRKCPHDTFKEKIVCLG